MSEESEYFSKTPEFCKQAMEVMADGLPHVLARSDREVVEWIDRFRSLSQKACGIGDCKDRIMASLISAGFKENVKPPKHEDGKRTDMLALVRYIVGKSMQQIKKGAPIARESEAFIRQYRKLETRTLQLPRRSMYVDKDVDAHIAEARELSSQYKGARVSLKINGLELIVTADSDPQTVMQEYNKRQKRMEELMVRRPDESWTGSLGDRDGRKLT
jgi:hypothetical protein